MDTYISPEFAASLEYLFPSHGWTFERDVAREPHTSLNPEELSFSWTGAPPPPVEDSWFAGVHPEPIEWNNGMQMMQPWTANPPSTFGMVEGVPGPSNPSTMFQHQNHTQDWMHDYSFDVQAQQQEDTEAFHPMGFDDSSFISDGAQYHGTTTLASASDINQKEAPSQEGEPPRGVLRSERITGFEGGVDCASPSAARPPRRKLRDGQLLIARKVARRIVEEIKNCDGKDVLQAERLECGSCYRKRLDGSRKDDRQYYRPELNALVRLSTTEGWVLEPKKGDRISSNVEFIPSDLLWIEDHLSSHLESMRRRSKQEVPRRHQAPRPWRVRETEGEGLIVFREGEVIVS